MSTAKTSAYDFVVLDGKKAEYPLSTRRGHPTLIMNVASQCGYAERGYTAATELYEKYKEFGFTVLAFPCNSFSSQEPGTEEEITHMACSRFKANFPIMKKVEVNGDNAEPLWLWLQRAKTGFLGTAFIKWNFTSFLVGPDGQVVERFSPGVPAKDVEKLLLPLLPPAAAIATSSAASATEGK